MKLNLIITMMLMTAVGCASKSAVSDSEAEARYAEASRIALEQGQTPEVKAFLGTMVGFWQQTLNAAGQACQAGSGRSVSLVITINEQGIIDDAIGSPWNNKSKCLAKLVTGKKVAVPPVNPMYSKLDLP